MKWFVYCWIQLLLLFSALPISTESVPENDVQLPQPYKEWAAWSQWSSCSKKCGSGVRRRLRRCLGSYCEGDSIIIQLCNKQKCSQLDIDYRTRSCSKMNTRPYRGFIFDRWSPVQTTVSPCALVCKAQHHAFSIKVEDRVEDGTRCHKTKKLDNEQQAFCVDGKCLTFGCDDVAGSHSSVDPCGVCGGDGAECRRDVGAAPPIYNWKDTYRFSPCDTSCGADRWRVSVSVCVENRTDRAVSESNCADLERPRPVIEPCPYVVCPAE